MSEQTNAQANNLCTTEDAFEQFQAASLYEEEEFITLSDILPPAPAALEPPSDLSDIPYDNEIELSSNLEYDTNSKLEPGLEETSLVLASETSIVDEKNPSVVVEDIPSVSVEESILSAVPGNKQKKHQYNQETVFETNAQSSRPKRVRKQKVPLSYDDSIAAPPNTILKSRRGRKPKQNDDKQMNTNNDQLSQQIPQSSRRGRKKQSEIHNTSQNMESFSSAEYPPVRRGRQKKVLQEKRSTNDLLNTLNGENIVSSELINKTPPDLKDNSHDGTIQDISDKSDATLVLKSGRKKRRGKKRNRRSRKAKCHDNARDDTVESALTELFGMNNNDTAGNTLDLSHLENKSQTDDICKDETNTTNIKAEMSEIKREGGDNNQELIAEEDLEDELTLSVLSQQKLPKENEENTLNEFSDMDIETEEVPVCKIQETLDPEIQDEGKEIIVDIDDNGDYKDSKKIENNLASDEMNDTKVNELKNEPSDSLLVENTSRRRVRRKTTQMHYEEESDEDPFANIELSDDDDEPRRKRKGRYNSDDEYIPGLTDDRRRRGRKRISESSDTDTDIDEVEDDLGMDRKQKKRTNSSPKKKPKLDSGTISDINVTTIVPNADGVQEDDIEVCLQSSVIKMNEESSSKLGWKKTGNQEFESFIAQKMHGSELKIKKVSSKEPIPSTTLEIPVLDAAAKKAVETGTQTNKKETANAKIQTDDLHDVPMKKKENLTPVQADKACKFLQSIVKTTSDLGQLMTQKSEDFITKRINTTYVTDTMKMDYCVQKTFLLLKLAKHNLVQMEQDLAKQYEGFLKVNGLDSCREQEKTMAPTEKTTDNDSDCEIVEEKIPAQNKASTSKFNPKTVFLNKELSIKIAKKPTPAVKQAKECKDKLNIKGKNAVWLNDSVMLKKVKSTQSFLAQDSRNKKPPDCYITEEMVSDFFKSYDKEQARKLCAPFTSTEWIEVQRSQICAYFFVKPDKFEGTATEYELNESFNFNETESSTAEVNINNIAKASNSRERANPASLFSLCTHAVRNHMHPICTSDENSTVTLNNDTVNVKISTAPITLFRLCLQTIKSTLIITSNSPDTLFRLCLQTLKNTPNIILNNNFSVKCNNVDDMNSFLSQDDIAKDGMPEENMSEFESYDSEELIKCKSPKSLFRLCLTKINNNSDNVFNDDENSLVSLLNKSEDEADDWISDLYSTDSEDIALKQNRTVCTDLSIHRNSFNKVPENVNFLKELCYNKILTLLAMNVTTTEHDPVEKFFTSPHTLVDSSKYLENSDYAFSSNFDNLIQNIQVIPMSLTSESKNGIKSLLSICVEWIKKNLKPLLAESDVNENIFFNETLIYKPKSLKEITLHCLNSVVPNQFKSIKKQIKFDDVYSPTNSKKRSTVHEVKRLAYICFERVSLLIFEETSEDKTEKSAGLTINSVNTLSEEAYQNIEDVFSDREQSDSPYPEDDGIDYCTDDGLNADFNESEQIAESREDNNSWVSQLKMKELKSCFIPSKPKDIGGNDLNSIAEEPLSMARVKLEPLESTDEVANPLEGLNESERQVGTTLVKTEPIQSLDEMTVIPDSIITKQEVQDELSTVRDPIERQDSSSFDVGLFESFVRTNKMMHPFDEPSDEIFSQSGSRIRRQHDPDYINDYEPNMGLLIPQTFEPINIETAKDCLMESSSDEEGNTNKTASKKKSDKKRGRPKKTDKPNKKDTAAPPTSKEKPVPPPPVVNNEVAVLTRRMRERIRQEEKKVISSDSETEDIPLSVKKNKDKKKSNEQTTSNDGKPGDEQIQCSNIDSTEQIDSAHEGSKGDSDSVKSFTGFTAVDQNEITSYQKFMKFVYNKIMPDVSEESEKATTSSVKETNAKEGEGDNQRDSPLINYEDPVEMLECEPTMPIFDESDVPLKRTKKPTNRKLKAKPVVKEAIFQDENKKADMQDKEQKEETILPDNDNSELSYTERYGWKCYPISKTETKLYQTPILILEKLPESFVDIYFEYQNISNINKEDQEVDRLINLNTLNRSTIQKDGKVKPKGKLKGSGESAKNADGSSSAVGLSVSENCNEFSPSEDEGADVDDEMPPTAPSNKETSENNFAKNSLMNDSDSDAPITRFKDEPIDEDAPLRRKKISTKTKTSPDKNSEHPENLMLTADKMMNKELHLLHAPVNLNEEMPEISDKANSVKSKKRSGLRSGQHRDRIKNEDDSSSDEEKQWVNTKEKLLKRLEKKQDTAIVDDAKRTKLVNEFIVRREEGKGRKRSSGGRIRGGRSTKKRLEREKQLRVLSNELYGESTHTAKGKSQSLFKGRRNIRKVIDKKSLARSTVIANMEEFERKCRLNQRQARLRELLHCEEGVNVLVINDEVCLEYDFETNHPVVSVHPFFTKVMKAHQYEGVKFMWDACFETLAMVESGHPGGGCILAHCMGLGKTLQVLALLHTVLTHPRVGMQRVLVCCPLSTVLNWVDEIHKWIGPVTDQIKVFELSKLKKTYERAFQLEDWYSGGGIFIIGYELFRSLTTLDPELDDIRPTIVNKIRTALLDPGPDIIVCDEGHLLKNDCSVLAVAMSRVATKRRIVLTGTPMQNNLREYYCMVNFIKPNLLGTYSEYSNRFENPIMNGQHRDSREEDIKLMKQRTHILHKVLEGCLQRQEASVLYPYLPKKHEYTVFISLTQVQWDLYKHYLQNYANHSKQSVLRDFHVLQKIWSHPQVLHNFQMKARDQSIKLGKMKPEKLEDDLAQEDLAASEDKVETKPGDIETWWLQYLDGGSMLDSLASSNKFVVVFRILDECTKLGDKVLIFSTSLFTMDSLEYFLKKINKWSLGQEYYRLDGSVPAEVRQKWCREFNAENNHKTKLFLISTRAGSLGLNMVAANRVIILDTSWNPAHDIQSIFRVYRFGQKKDCHIYRLVALGTMEQKIYERSVTKQAVACRVVDEQQIERHYNMAELTELYRYDEMGTGVAGGVAAGVRDVALLRVAAAGGGVAGGVHAVHEHDSLLRGSAEPSLPEHERAAAWMQFQQEHAHKQMQNQLTSSFSLHITTNQRQDHDYSDYSALSIPNMAQSSHIPQPDHLKTENSPIHYTQTDPPPLIETKSKKGKKIQAPKVKIPKEAQQANQQEPNMAAAAIQDDMVKKIMHILVQHNYQNAQGPLAISELVSRVRKMVACGRVTRGGFGDEITRSIANVLLGKEPAPQAPPPSIPSPQLPPMPARTNVVPELEQTKEIDDTKPKRGRPKKKRGRGPRKSEPTSILPHAEQQTYPDGIGRRKSAIAAAEKQLENNVDDIVDLDDDDWQGDADDNDYTPDDVQPGPSQENPATKPTEDASIKKEKPDQPTHKVYSKKPQRKEMSANAEKQLNTELSSILLSDDEETSTTNNEKAQKKSANKVNVPLHPSLLGNKNFIKIIAHTYLEGNPMLDEDAATLAAQYSALKAQKEYESTGKPIDSGPIYDIAIKVLGKDILEKLNKSNLKVKTIETSTPQVKTEVQEKPQSKPKAKAIPEPPTTQVKSEVQEKPRAKLKAKAISELTGKPQSETVQPNPRTPQPRPQTPQGNIEKLLVSRMTATGIATSAAGSADTTASPAVVPIGMFARAIRMPAAAGMSMQPKEESILPDDDDVIISDSPTPAPAATAAHPAAARNARQLVINAVTSAVSAGAQKPLPKIKIAGGRIVLSSTPPKLEPTPVIMAQAPTSIVPDTVSQNDTICLDSDEEETITSNVQPTPQPAPTKRPIAVKSTAKPPVPVQLTAVNPQLNKPPGTNPNFVVVPASSIGTLTPLGKGLVSNKAAKIILAPRTGPILNQQNLDLLNQQNFNSMQQENIRLMNQVNILNQSLANQVPQNILNHSLANQVPQNAILNQIPQSMMMQQNINSMQMQQNLNMMPQNQMMHQNVNYAMAQNMNYSMPQNINMMNMPMTVTSSGQQMIISNMNTGSIVTPNENNDVAESILPTSTPNPPPSKPKPGPASSKTGLKKTVCKPGDILRITKTGQVEILNRDNEGTEILGNSVTPATTTKEKAGKVAGPASKTKKSVVPETNTVSLSDDEDEPQPPTKAQSSGKKPGRPRKESSSSSSESSRSSSPDRSDPLSILKDVVHIRADDFADTYSGVNVSRRIVKDKTPVKPSTSSPKSSLSKSSNPKPITPSKPNSKPENITPQSSKKDKIIEQIKNTNNVLKKLNDVLGPQSKATKRQANVGKIDSVDLTDVSPTASKVLNRLSKDIKIGKSDAKEVPQPQTVKVVGTSKNIIISGSGKAKATTAVTAVADNQSKKTIRVTNVEKIVPASTKWSDTKKRPATSDAGALKKKKTEPMTLKDFNIDDIDDIIELE